MSKRIQARARVQVTFDILLPDTWGSECSVEQVQKQAAESALGVLRQGLVVDGLTNSLPSAPDMRPRVTSVGMAKVIAVLVEDD